jgi:hypothetical protein
MDSRRAPKMVALDELPAAVRAVRVEKYLQWIAKLEETRAGYLRRKPIYRNGFFVFCAMGVGCFAISKWAGLWGVMTTSFISVSGWMMLVTRVWELDSEIAATRREIASLQHDARAPAGDGRAA